MPNQSEAEKLVRKGLKESKKTIEILGVLQWCLVVGILIMAVIAFTHPAFDGPTKPQFDDDESCYDKMPEECKEYFGGMMDFAGVGILWMMIYMFLIIMMWMLTSSKRDGHIKQLKLEHALEIDQLKKKGRK